MKFTRFLAPDSVALLDFRVAVRSGACPHCQCRSALIAHGHLRGHAAEGHEAVTRALRFFCSNRHSKSGCGRTFPVYWSHIIPACSLRTVQLLALLRAACREPSIHAAWHSSSLAFSYRCASRWVARWRSLTTHVRTWLHRVVAPPIKTDDQPDPASLRHLTAAFPGAACPIAAFQSQLQTPITG